MDPLVFLIIIVLIIAWGTGVAVNYTAGGLLHILLVIALVILIYRLLTGQPLLK